MRNESGYERPEGNEIRKRRIPMKYCKKCGAELPEGAGFCEKCGNPVGEAAKQGGSKKKWILAVSLGVIVLAAATVGTLAAIGVIGGKEDVAQTGAGVTTGQSGVTGAAVSGGSVATVAPKEVPGEKDKSAEDAAWEAYNAYKAYLKGRDETEDISDDVYYRYALIYLDSDDYPELVEYCNMPTVENIALYTYKNGEVTNTEFKSSGVSYKKRQGYLYDVCRHSAVWAIDVVGELEGTRVTILFDGGFTYNEMEDPDTKLSATVNEEEVPVEEYDKRLAEYIGNENDWDAPEYFETIDEAFTILLKNLKEE